jgi:hypothetical protein
MSTPYIVNHVKGRMWLPDDVDLQEMDWTPVAEEASAQRLAPGAELGIEQTTRRARPTSKRIPYGHAIRRLLAVK